MSRMTHRRIPFGPALTALVVASVTSPALATFGDDAFQTEEISAFTLRAEELKVGPTAVRYGIVGQFQLGTGFALNLLGAINGDLKWRIYQTDVFALGLESGVIHFDPGVLGIDETDFSVTAFPLKLEASFIASDAFQVHLRVSSLLSDPVGQATDVVLRIQRYLGPVGRLAAELYFEWRVTEHFAVVVDYALPMVMLAEEMLYADEDPGDRAAMMRAAASLLGTFESFNFRVGVGYGPSFLGKQGVFPIVDLYWRIF